MNPITILEVLALLAFAGFLAGSESAINSISRISVDQIAEKSPKRAVVVRKVTNEPARYLNVVLLVRKACELTATVFVAESFLQIIDNSALAITTAITIMLVLSYVVVGVGPRTLGKQRASGWAVM